MYDRVAADWRLAHVAPPLWSDADAGETSLFRQFPLSVRATSCLLHLRPFKHVLHRARCVDGAKHHYLSSHLSTCLAVVPGAAAREPAMHARTIAFPHFRFTSNAAVALSEKRLAYELSSAAWREAHGTLASHGTPASVRPQDFEASTEARLAFSNVEHAAKAYKAAGLLFAADPSRKSASAPLRVRPEVRLLLELACGADRPGTELSRYDAQTSGRLNATARRVFFRILAVDDAQRARNMLSHFFKTRFATKDAATRYGTDVADRLRGFIQKKTSR